MGLKEIPILPPDYPLFDWADWQSSRDALVKGGPTRRFESACWNAIVDTLADALEEAGVEWLPGGFEDGRYQYTVEDIKMTKDKRLKSSSMNRVIANIENIINFGWGWEVDPSFRGYTGFNQFREMPYRDGKDKVYPEYFIELVRHLNLMLEIMRGTALTQDFPTISIGFYSISDPGLRASISASIGPHTKLRTRYNAHMTSGIAHPFGYDTKVFSIEFAHTEKLRSLNIDVWQKKQTNIYAHGNVGIGIYRVPKSVLEHSWSFASMTAKKLIDSKTKWLAESASYTDAITRESIVTAASFLSTSAERVNVLKKLWLVTSCQEKIFSGASARIIQKDPLPTKSEYVSNSNSFAVSDQVQATYTKSAVNSYSETDIQINKGTPLPTSGKAISFSFSAAGVDSTESLPVVINHNSAIKKLASLHDVKARPTWVEHKSASITRIGANKPKTSNFDTELKISSKVRCSLDTGWLPPVWINGGLWIRQVYALTQNEDGSLEVI